MIGSFATAVAARRHPVLPPAIPAPSGALAFGNTNPSRHVELGALGLPAGDWTLHLAHRSVASTTADGCLFSLGVEPAGGHILDSSGHLSIIYSSTGGLMTNVALNGAYLVCFRDDAGMAMNERRIGTVGSSIAGTTGARYLASERRGVAVAGAETMNDGKVRSLFVRRINQRLEFWMADAGGRAKRIDWGEFDVGPVAAKPALLGALNRATVERFGVGSVQDLFLVGAAMSRAQMEQVARGVDPRRLVTFEPSRGDRYWPADLAAAPADGASLTEVISGQNGTIRGTGWATPTPLLPVTLEPEVRVDLWGFGQVFARAPAPATTTDVPLRLRHFGATADVQMRVVDFDAPANVVVDWQTVVQGLADGTEAKITLRNVPHRKQWYDLEVRRVVGGVPQPGVAQRRMWGVGIVYGLVGQSRHGQFRSGSIPRAVPGTSPATGFVSGFQMYCGYSGGSQPRARPQGWQRHNGGSGYIMYYGESMLSQVLVERADCVVALADMSISASPMQNFIGEAGATAPWLRDRIIDAFILGRPTDVFFAHSLANAPDTKTEYKARMAILYQMLADANEAEGGWTWRFWVMGMHNSVTEGNSPGIHQKLREAQLEWVAENAFRGNVFVGGHSYDTMLADVVHSADNDEGKGREVERMAQTVLFANGLATHSGVGPAIVSATWSGTRVDVRIAHNGGTDIRPPGFGTSYKGFEVSADDTFAAPIPVVSAVRLDPTTIRLTLATAPAAAPFLRYMYGRPGFGETMAIISNAVAGPGNVVRLTATLHKRASGDVVWVHSVNGVPGANGIFAVTVVDANTLDLVGSSFSGAWTASASARIFPTNGIEGAVYDNRTPLVNSDLGFPMSATNGPLRAV